MADRSTAAVTRKSLPLNDRDLRDLALLRSSREHREALNRLADLPVDGDSEAAFLRALLEAGMKAVIEQVEAEGYAQIAAEMDVDLHRAFDRRRRPDWADE